MTMKMRVVDSHTEGEPTRLIIDGGPPLGRGPLSERRERFAREFDGYRSFAVNEPRGYDALVGALLCEPEDPSCAGGLIFFNNVGYLGMCGHGTIGVAVTLAHLGRIGPGKQRFETPVGVVTADLRSRNEVSIDNVASYRHREGVSLDVEGLGRVEGDIAWGGNWFFLANRTPYPLVMSEIPSLTRAAEAVSRTLGALGIFGADGAPIDHIEFFGPPLTPEGHSRNFVLCPGGAYDRSPCGTGTSAKIACLAASGKLRPGAAWVQEGIVGGRFIARYRNEEGAVIPSITGRAFVVADAVLMRDPDDPFGEGLRPHGS
jgi:4-hydroxyproline epimerase